VSAPGKTPAGAVRGVRFSAAPGGSRVHASNLSRSEASLAPFSAARRLASAAQTIASTSTAGMIFMHSSRHDRLRSHAGGRKKRFPGQTRAATPEGAEENSKDSSHGAFSITSTVRPRAERPRSDQLTFCAPDFRWGRYTVTRFLPLRLDT
jgi:hypothetical protein